MESVIIVVPTYRLEMDAFERISWQQLQRVLGKYPICMVAPRSLSENLRRHYHVQVEAFEDAYFKNIKNYSRMMLMQDFYERFAQFRYMLLYQLDAFVFSDRLPFFCQLGFDYIGAPWPLWMTVGRKFPIPHVGNGGLSLRNIDSACRVLEQKENILQMLSPKDREFCLDAEDVFWSYCGSRKDLHFRLADVVTARMFSVEHWSHWQGRDGRSLPFGFHDGSRRNLEWWRSFVEACGYMVPQILSPKICDGPDGRKQRLFDYLLQRCLRQWDPLRVKHGIASLKSFHQRYILWGLGKNGRSCIQIFSHDATLLSAICDEQKAGDIFDIDGKRYCVQMPEKSMRDHDGVILVSTTKFFMEIRNQLLLCGLRQGTDFVGYTDFLSRFFAGYYSDFWKEKEVVPL